METLCKNDNWLRQKRDSSLGKLLFTNGYFDGRTEMFYHGSKGFNPEILFFHRILHEFGEFSEADMEYMTDIKERFFYATLGVVVGDYLIQNLARGLMGDRMKRILFALGNTNSGKGVLTRAITLSCGGYVGTFNAECLCHRMGSSQEEAQQLRWALLLANKRLLLSNEMDTKSDLNGNMIKKLASGGDALIGRQHGGNETEFTMHSLQVVFANDLSDITPYDDAVDSRVRLIRYTKQYVENPNPTNENELKMDDSVKYEIESERFQRCFVGLLVNAYVTKDFTEPDEVKNSKKDWFGENEGDIVKKFLVDFEITNNPEDYTASDEIQEWLKTAANGITIKKFGSELKRHCAAKKYEQVNNDNKKLLGRVKKVWYGIKRIVEEEEDNNEW
jgi:phage/plasmid-associated DNA primase